MPPSKTSRTSRQKEKTASAQSATQPADKSTSARKGRAVGVKAEEAETSSLNNHRKSAAAPAAEVAVAAPAKAMAAAAAGSASVTTAASTTTVPVSEMAQPVADILMPEITSAQIAELAHSYYVARGHEHGYADEDWHRAERELRKN